MAVGEVFMNRIRGGTTWNLVYQENDEVANAQVGLANLGAAIDAAKVQLQATPGTPFRVIISIQTR